MNSPKVDIQLPGHRLGLLSDSHGDAAITRAAVGALIDAGAEALIHLGDVCSMSVIDCLAGCVSPSGEAIPARLVWGNMDFETDAGRTYAKTLEVGVDHPYGSYRMAGRRLLAHHGHIGRFEASAADSGYDFFLHGHTHKPRDERIKGVRRLNPGALHRASRLTCGLFDLSDESFQLIEVPEA